MTAPDHEQAERLETSPAKAGPDKWFDGRHWWIPEAAYDSLAAQLAEAQGRNVQLHKRIGLLDESHRVAQAQLAGRERAIKEADEQLHVYEQEASHGKTANVSLLDMCVRKARAFLAAHPPTEQGES